MTASPLGTTATSDKSDDMVREGLEGVIVAKTAVSSVGLPNIGLAYRGIPVPQLIDGATFEEVSLLLITGSLPDRNEHTEFKKKIAQGRVLCTPMKTMLELLDSNTHPMDVIRTAASFYSCLGNPNGYSDNVERAAHILGLLPSVVCYWWNFAFHGKRIDTSISPDASVGEHFLHCLNQEPPCQLSIDSVNKTLIAYAEHDLNASTFSARVTASTLADYYCCIVSAINTLKGPLHGGANQAALVLLESFNGVKDIPARLTEMLNNKEKIMGFGHRVYKTGDPRHFIMKSIAQELSECKEAVDPDPVLFSIAETLEREMISRKGIHPNLDFFASVVYKQLGIPKNLFTVIFAMGRTAGWTAHIEEQNQNNKLIRPKSKYVGNGIEDFHSRL